LPVAQEIVALVRSGKLHSLASFATCKVEYGFIVFVGAQEEYLRLQSEQQNSKKSKDEELAAAMEIKSLKDVVSDLRNKLEHLQLDANSKEKEVKVLKVSMRALEKQTEGFRLEYNRLMDDNESLRNQLAVFDRKQSTLESKKNS
jgi:B-cell receptor-associated protein 31